jgi:tripartite-type tricarboxylate transporter receptor subunit TctC
MKQFYLLHVAMFVQALLAGDAGAQGWPARPIRAIVPIAAGSIADVVPRTVFEQLSAQLGQPIIVENQPGAAQTIGTGIVARSEPDGYTLLATSAAHAIAPSLRANLGYHPSRDFAAVIPLGVTPSVLVVPPARGFRSLAEFVTAARARPGAMNFGSAGVGTATHLSAERFMQSAGVEAVHVPFKGGPEIITEVIAGRIDFFFGPLGVVLPHIKAGRLTALAVNGVARAAQLPEVPTTAEAGLVNAEYPFWIGVFVPKATPRAVVDKLNAETRKALQEPKLRDKLAALGVEPMLLTPAEFDAYLEKEIAVNAALVKAIGLKPE